MTSVTSRIKTIKQPRGGYLNPKIFEEIQIKDNIELKSSENISPGLIGMVVDYLTRFTQGSSLQEAFSISIIGAEIVCETAYANQLLSEVKGLDDLSITNACKLVGYDVVVRQSKILYRSVQDISPDLDTIFNIRTMIERSNSFFSEYGPVINTHLTFPGGYTSFISSGDADFLTKDTLWDMKVSKNKIKSDSTLQLLVYYLMGKNSIHEVLYDDVYYLGIFNPRLNKVYRLDVTTIDTSIIEAVSKDVIGY